MENLSIRLFAGTISFILSSYGGAASDRYITETCGILKKLSCGGNLMAQNGFNVSDLLVIMGSKWIIPPFISDRGRFSRKNCRLTLNTAKVQIHIERAVARVKDFKILYFFYHLKTNSDDIFAIRAAIINFAPGLVPL